MNRCLYTFLTLSLSSSIFSITAMENYDCNSVNAAQALVTLAQTPPNEERPIFNEKHPIVVINKIRNNEPVSNYNGTLHTTSHFQSLQLARAKGRLDNLIDNFEPKR